MEADIKAWWLTMSDKRLINHLTNKLKYPPPMVQSIAERVRALREQRRAKRLRKSVGYDLWTEFIAPARAEAQTVRATKTQLKKSNAVGSPKWAALEEYGRVINVMIERFARMQRSGEATPKQFPDWLKAQGKRAPEYDGSHWTDYVSHKDKARITAMFDSLPPVQRGKTKQPFTRTLPSKLYKNKRFALIEALNLEIEQTEQAYNMATTEHERERLNEVLDRMYRANYLLDNHKKNQPLPNTWHGLLK